ncbi:MAG: N-acetyl-gamma-glutamyl-phosphate reductase, partial [Clostridia bacterium]|nr:N-acetyl-gamma-glutamyl-phosphate reductase [Clostridia bacterium]
KGDSSMLSPIGLEGTNKMMIHLNGNDDRITVTSVFDNLGKGASSAAIENMNIALGYPAETALI